MHLSAADRWKQDAGKAGEPSAGHGRGPASARPDLKTGVMTSPGQGWRYEISN